MSADDELLGLLGRTIEAPAAEPSMAELASLQRAVAARHTPAARRRWHWGPRTLAVAIGIGALTTSGTAFALEGGHLPQPVVSVARTFGLPVEKPAPATTTTSVPPTADAPAVVPPRPARPATTIPARRPAETPPRPQSTTPTSVESHHDDNSGRGRDGGATTTSTTPSTTSTTRVDNSGHGSSGGSGDGGSDHSGSSSDGSGGTGGTSGGGGSSGSGSGHDGDG